MSNPFLRLYEAPVETLTALAYAVVLLAALVATWYVLGRNLLYLANRYQNGWKYLVPLGYAARVVGGLLIVAVDLALIAGVIAVLS